MPRPCWNMPCSKKVVLVGCTSVGSQLSKRPGGRSCCLVAIDYSCRQPSQCRGDRTPPQKQQATTSALIVYRILSQINSWMLSAGGQRDPARKCGKTGSELSPDRRACEGMKRNARTLRRTTHWMRQATNTLERVTKKREILKKSGFSQVEDKKSRQS